MPLLKAQIVKSSHILLGIYFLSRKKCPRSNCKVFQDCNLVRNKKIITATRLTLSVVNVKLWRCDYHFIFSEILSMLIVSFLISIANWIEATFLTYVEEILFWSKWAEVLNLYVSNLISFCFSVSNLSVA